MLISLFSVLRPTDEWLLRQINSHWGVPQWDGVMALVSNFSFFKIPLAVLVLILLVWGHFRERALLVLIGLCLLIGDAGINWAIKKHSNRPRPYEALERIRVLERGQVEWSQPGPVAEGHSFTSGHACNNVALAVVLTLLYGRWAACFAWPWAALVSYSRIYTGSHYPTDILGSWLIAPVYAYLICQGCAWLWRKNGARWLPHVWKQHPELFAP